MAGSAPQPDNEAALRFLERWRPGGPWLLAAIATDKKSVAFKHFDGTQSKALGAWLGEYNGTRNIYFHVNPLRNRRDRKAEREDVAALAWLHVDIDPRAGEDIEEERQRALGLLTHTRPEGVPPPTCVVFSGGGYQGFWRLEEPLELDGTLDAAEDAKLFNLQLEVLFRADHCHNIDRIMRLPGTINLPDARKAKRGRVPELATVVSFEDVSYPLSAFQRAPRVQGPGTEFGGGGEGATRVEVEGQVLRIVDLGELDEWSVPDRVKVIIAQGRHPDEAKDGDDSRSAWLFDALCNLARCGVPDEVMYSLITDSEWGISESVIELKSRAHAYALRQIQRAKEHAIDPALEELNARFAVIETIGGRCRVVEEVMDPALQRPRLTIQSFEDFRNRWMHQRVQIGTDAQGKPVYMPKGKWWLQHPQRQQYRTVVFAPGRETPHSYNMWKGFACEAIPGDCSLFLEHVRSNICRGDEALFEYTLGWLARAVQNPGSPGEVAMVLRGGRGTGKSFFAVEVGRLFGRHFLHVSNSSHLTGNFNAHLRDLVMLFADEAFYANDKKHESILKTLITESTLTIERKGVDVETAPNYIHLIMASNEMHVVPAGGDERRFFVLDVGSERQKDTAYFRAIRSQLDDGGREALLHMLMGWELGEFQVRDVPATEALSEQKLLSLDAEEDWWYQKLLNGQVHSEDDGWPPEVMTSAVADDYWDRARRANVGRRASETRLGQFLRKVVPGLRTVRRMTDFEIPTGDGFVRKVRRRAYFYVLPSLVDCRAAWDRLYGAQAWPSEEALPARESQEVF